MLDEPGFLGSYRGSFQTSSLELQMGNRLTQISLIGVFGLFVSGCQVPYLLKNSWYQTRLLKSRVPIPDIIEDPKTSEEVRKRLKLVQEVKVFATEELNLKDSASYETFVQLDRPYVTWIVRAAPPFELKPYEWWFPIVGSVPYKGYFHPDGAKHEANELKEEGYDTYVRGVSAYSTLGWFHDPVLSSMLRYSEHDLVNVILHETVHATVFIGGHIDFNERLATFIGNQGTELFYRSRQSGAEVIAQIADENYDQELFSKFISGELKALREFYKSNKGSLNAEIKSTRIAEIQQRFRDNLQLKLRSGSYDWFPEAELNNASLLSLETYQADLADFQAVYDGLGRDFKKLMKFAKSLEDEKHPEKALKKAAKKFSAEEKSKSF